jgi:hypothetical protein
MVNPTQSSQNPTMPLQMKSLQAAAEATSDRLWALPLDDIYMKVIFKQGKEKKSSKIEHRTRINERRF